MIVEQLPSLEQIYDFSSEDLKQIAARLIQKITLNPDDRQRNAQLQEYIENINIELEERKTLEFFQELCARDNPYVKKVTDFNNQFLKLAEEAIAQKEIDGHEELQQKSKRQSGIQSSDSHDGVSVTSATSSNSHFSKNTQYQKNQKNYTSSDKRISNGEKRMGLGTTKSKVKNSMKDFIVSTLTKNKVDCTYVVKKAGPPKPQPAFTVNERGHLVSPSTLEPISTKSIKSNSSFKPQSTPLSSTKQVSEAPKKPNEKELDKKRQQVAEKLKGKQPERKKQKHLNNKDLVEMIREQQRQKQKRLTRQYETAVSEKKSEGINQKEDATQQADKVNKRKVERAEDFEMTTFEQSEIKQQIHIEEEIPLQKPKEQITITEQIKEQILIEEPIKTSNQTSSLIHKVQHESMPQREQIDSAVSNQSSQQKDSSLIQSNPASAQQHFQQPPKQTAIQNTYQQQIEELKQIKRETQLEEQNFAALAFKKKEEPFGVIVDLNTDCTPPNEIDLTLKEPEKDLKKEVENKKCYNEDYWIHIREEAEFQIKRFKEQKQLEESQKNKITKELQSNIEKAIQKRTETPEEPQQEGLMPQSIENRGQSEEEADEFYEKKKKQLKKMINDHKKRVLPKRISAATVVAPPKPLYVLPNFNYLEIYPTFNHIFSVMYTKAEHQAIQDIPSIMKELTNIFTTHINHFKSKNTFFQAAIFLPFDSASKTQMTDPKQLLLHTQTTYVNLKKMVERLQIFNSNLHGQYCEGENRYYRVVKTKQQVYDIITTGFLRRKLWKELPHGCSLRSSWNLFWSWSKPDIDISKLLVWQRINHFPFNKNLSRKDLLYKNLDAFRKLLKVPFAFLPLTYNLPKEYTQFSIKFHEEEMINRDMNYWIMKPIGKSRGRGIKVISNLAELNYTDNIVVQKYIINPLLLQGYKFDMRIYVLVTSFHPLQAFVYREGFARLSTEKFSLEPMMMKNAYIHLTNFAVNKNNEEAKQSAHFSGGSKISLKTLKDKLTKMNYSFPKIWSQVHEIIIKSLLGCSVSVPPFPAAFQLFGYDIMIDTEGSCHLIEINASPSLERAYLIDEIIKQSLIDDILDIVDPPQFDKQQLLDIMSDRLAGKGKITPEEDMIAIARCLKYKKVRKIGQLPQNMGLFQRVAPSQMSTDLQRLIKSRSGANNPKNID